MTSAPSLVRCAVLTVLLTGCSTLTDPASSKFEGTWEGTWVGLVSLHEAGDPPIDEVQLTISDDGEAAGTARFIDRSRPTTGYLWLRTMELELSIRGIVLENGEVVLEAEWTYDADLYRPMTGLCTFTGRLRAPAGGQLVWQGPFPGYSAGGVGIEVHSIQEAVAP